MRTVPRPRTSVLYAILAASAALMLPSAAYAEDTDTDFGPWYAIVGSTLHMAEVASFDDSYGFHLRLGARESDWFGYELHYEYIAALDGPSFVPTAARKRSFDNLEIHALMPVLRFRQKIGFIEPYALFGVGVLIGDVSTPRNARRTDLGYGMRTGGGLLTSFDFPVNVYCEYTRVFAGGRTAPYDFSTVSAGLEARF